MNNWPVYPSPPGWFIRPDAASYMAKVRADEAARISSIIEPEECCKLFCEPTGS